MCEGRGLFKKVERPSLHRAAPRCFVVWYLLVGLKHLTYATRASRGHVIAGLF